MNKSFFTIIIISLGLVAALYSLPKIIVSEKKKPTQLGIANRDVPRTDAKELEKEEHSDSDGHDHAVQSLSPSQLKEINLLKEKYSKATTDNKFGIGLKIVEQFNKYQKYDSAAIFSEQLVSLKADESSLVTTGNLYYQAFTYALDDTKAQKMGEKARAFYQKAIDKNPNLLLAKTNIAMTYVSTPTPMAGILLLREVVGQSPDFEPALFNLGLLSMRSNQFSKAVERFKHIIKNNPSNSKAAFYLGISLARLGRNTEAKEILLKVKDTDKDPAIQAELSTLLNELN